MLPGIIVRPLKRFADERGFFTEIMRNDWTDVFSDEVCQANMSITYPGVVRAWHKHEKGQIDRFLVVKGTLQICAYDEETRELDEIVSSGRDLQVVRVPGCYWHGFKVVGNETATLVYFVNRLYCRSDPDEIRRPWNDKAVIPALVNGIKNDRCGIAWDWFASSFK